jgi:hypothetical protein
MKLWLRFVYVSVNVNNLVNVRNLGLVLRCDLFCL